MQRGQGASRIADVEGLMPVPLARSRIISWRDRTMYDDYAANADEPIIYKRTAGCGR